MSDNSKLNRHKYSIRVDLDCSVCGVNGLDESCEDCQGEGKYWVTQLIPRDVLDTITQDAIALNATSSDNSKLIEALECAKYAIENPDSNQDFAVWAIDHALNSATSSERVSISRECAEYAAECMSAETRRVEGICERLLDGKVPDKIHQRFKLIKELRAALEKNDGTM